MKSHKNNEESNKEPELNKEFWDKTKYNIQNAKNSDSVEEITPTHLENQNIFFSDLDIPLKKSATHSQGIPSKIDPTLLVTDKNWVVSLVRKSIHTYIVVESLGFGNDQGLTIRWFDYLPKFHHGNRACWGAFSNPQSFFTTYIENKAVPAIPRYCPTNDGFPLSNIPEAISKKELFAKIHWNEESSSCVCPRLNVKAMMKDIRNDFKLADENKLKFRMRSHFKLNSNRIPNCTTWTWAKLKKAGIHAENSSIINHFIVEASHNVGPKHKLTYVNEKPETPKIKI